MNANALKNHVLVSRLAFVAVTIIGLVISVGCRSTPERPPLQSELARQDVKTTEINYQLFDFVIVFSRSVEQAADEIARTSSEAAVRRNALLWKLNAIPASYLATEHSDSWAILVDLWALCVQQAEYFESGAGKDLFGAQQPLAIEASKELLGEISSMAGRLVRADVLALARKEIMAWAAAHPLEDPLFARPSIVTMLADTFPERPQGLFQTLNSVPAELEDLRGRLALHMDHLPRQARWQAELLADEIATKQLGAQLTNAFRLAALEREAILAAFDRQRIETLQALKAERIAALRSVSDQRVATLEETRKIMEEMVAELGRSVDTQREALLKAVDVQRRDTLADLRADPIPLRHDVEPLVNATLDRMFTRIVLLLAGSYAVLLVTVLIWYALVKKRQRAVSAP